MMRSLLALAVCGLTVALLGLGSLGCYDVSDIGGAPFRCSQDFPDCPDGYHCDLKLCLKNSGSWLTVPKTETYQGDKEANDLDPSNCPGGDREPGDNGFVGATELGTGSLSDLAICPKGDIDVFTGYANGPVMVTINYQVAQGDLDLAFVSPDTGQPNPYDGSAKTNGCVLLNSSSGTFYVAVVGALNKEMNYYTIKMQTGSNLKCP